jgi:hypothetical protein
MQPGQKRCTHSASITAPLSPPLEGVVEWQIEQLKARPMFRRFCSRTPHSSNKDELESEPLVPVVSVSVLFARGGPGRDDDSFENAEEARGSFSTSDAAAAAPTATPEDDGAIEDVMDKSI